MNLTARIFTLFLGLGLALSGSATAASVDITSSLKVGDYLSMTNSSGVGELGSPAAAASGYANGGIAWSAGRFQRGGVNFQLGFGLGAGERWAPYFGFGMNSSSYKNDYLFDFDGDGDDESRIDQGAAVQIGIEAGMRAFFADRGHSLASPFFRVSFSKYLGFIDEYVADQDGVDYYGDILCAGNDDSSCGEDYERFDEAILSPQGFKFALGAEYYFNDNFAVGADLLGVELFWASATNPQDAQRLSNYVSVAFYSTLNISYRFLPKKRVKQDKPSYDSDSDSDSDYDFDDYED
ncbi:MAG: hypothetical protein CMP23_04875 [Rickettsiales bacterium]|nr:hypothetical protein [Rickettsiales bacterium]|tara:strand:+ start:829 stop:1710 length:882 start_codon:yes stop_codon:yes gene_type:complete